MIKALIHEAGIVNAGGLCQGVVHMFRAQLMTSWIQSTDPDAAVLSRAIYWEQFCEMNESDASWRRESDDAWDVGAHNLYANVYQGSNEKTRSQLLFSIRRRSHRHFRPMWHL
jgi:hypothetical protein